MNRIKVAGRLFAARNSLRYRRLLTDFPWTEYTNVWTDTVVGSFLEDKVYVVQTSPKVVARCLLMTTDPGDLVLFEDQAPREVYATLLDEEQYLCHWRTMYRVLAENDEVRERRNQLRHPAYAKPELLATGPCQVWSWDITKLRGPQKGHCYYRYVILDIFSRYVVGWMIAEVESAELAEQLIAETCAKQGVVPDQLTIHADNGGPMTAKSVAVLMADLGVAKSHTRPYQSNDNCYSEAHFKTLKYRPDYPDRFGSVADARTWAKQFFAWYNHRHHHSGLALLTPFDVHYGWTDRVLAKRQAVLQRAYAAHPERFVKGTHPYRPDHPRRLGSIRPRTGHPRHRW